MIGRIRKSQFSQVAIVFIALPLAAMPLAAKSEMMSIELCSSDGAMRTINIPVDQENGDNDCAKPCHACLSRKKSPKN